MQTKFRAANLTSVLLSSAGIAAIVGSASAQSITDEIVVTSQRTEQSLQDVPIAVSAFSGADLQARQLESFTDIQFNTPNFSFSKGQFTSSTISIRGIGALATGASTEPSTSIHINDVFISAPRLFETEFFDVERIEVLRGPQGTLFGRNATGGVINVITNKATTDGVEGYIDAEYGNFSSVRVNGALNLPLADALAVRLAGTLIQRDGYTENIFDGSDVDDRNIHALRGSVRWLPTDNTTVDFTASYMREDDKRTRAQKQACADGPLKPLLGCQPGVPLDFTSSADARATFFANASAETFALTTGSPAAAAFGLYSLTEDQSGQAQPADPRQVNIDFTPQYDAEETIFLLNAKHDFERFSVKLNAGWGNSKVASRSDFDGGVGPDITVPPALATLPGVAALYADGLFPVSDFDTGIEGPNDGLTGIIGGFVQERTSRFSAIDLSIGETDYWSVEGVVNTNFDGRFNFLGGINYIETNGQADYAVATNGLDYFSVVSGTLATQAAQSAAAAAAAAAAGGDAAAQAAAAQSAADAVAAQGFAFYTPYFYNDADDAFLESLSFFGEVYIDLTDTLRFTGGVRHNRDTKGNRDRGNLLDSTSTTNPAILGGVPPVVPLGTTSVRPLLDANELVQCDPLGTFCADGGVNDFRVVEDDFNATTGRAVLQWTPTSNAQLYVSYTRGYKPGGFNPRTNSADVPLVFDEETINSFEAGVKSNLLDGALQANLTGFYYDYSGLQVTRITANTAVNENIDATVFGLEGEFVYRPTDELIINLNASYLNTEAGEFSTVDDRNPTQFQPGLDLIADLTTGSNCVIDNAGAPSLIGQNFDAVDPLLTTLFASNFSICSELPAALAGLNAALGTNYSLLPNNGVEVSVEGNELPNSPEFTLGAGVQYTAGVGTGYTLTPRLDVYYQSESFSNIFNTAGDQIDGYAYLNGQVAFAPEDANWSVRFFVQNLTDEDAVTGQFDVGAGAGNWTNVFLLEPRRWGFGVNMNF